MYKINAEVFKKKQMDSIIKITTNKQGESVVSARELYDFLGATERFNNWFERQTQYGFVENIDYVGCEEFNTLANQSVMNYALTVDCAKEISMLQRTEKGKQARLYFIECEKKLQKPKELSRLEILELALESEKRAIEAEKTVAILTHVTKNYTVTEISKELQMKSAKVLNEKLRQMGIQFKSNDTWVLYSKYANLGYFDIKQEVLDNGKVIYHRKVTQLGREFIIKLFTKKLAE